MNKILAPSAPLARVYNACLTLPKNGIYLTPQILLMSEKYKVIEHDQPNFITLTIVGWIDLFVRPVYTKILDESFEYCITSKGLLIHAYVYMTSHLHLIVSSQKEDINTIIRDFKSIRAKNLLKPLKNILKVEENGY